MATTKPELTLVGPSKGAPDLQDIIELYRKLTGKEPTAQDIEDAKRELARP